jgi:hypothetical protein
MRNGCPRPNQIEAFMAAARPYQDTSLTASLLPNVGRHPLPQSGTVAIKGG